MAEKFRYTLYHDIRRWNGKDEHLVLASIVVDKNCSVDMNLDLAERFFAFEFYKVLLESKHNGEGYAFNMRIPDSLDDIREDPDLSRDKSFTELGFVHETVSGLYANYHRFYIERTKEQKGTQQ